ncbi:esterase-like activity of phytase family protein [Tabrizicola sp.]|uniref:esterase-like activity of phytase family protein n=1 Tax=Tabrizicola sp. TaxID=2005166 RepID=UPI00273307C5|nr:esterase-like activity of phytase family protein [Tabrizicola sp.]MDP3194032.1 esterase-like activity of phytase family protein [Tabrizicola sp.]
MRLSALTLCTALVSLPVAAETTFPATLAGHALIPAATYIPAPADAPQDAQMSGKFTGAARAMEAGTVPGDTGAMHGKRLTGLSLPFDGQPLQGMSGFAMNLAEDGSIYVLADNGFGTKANSPDALLAFHRMTPDFATGAVAVNQTVFLRDPDMKVPFRIAYEGSDSRYLTGADFDPESIQLLNGELWIGEEFGPYILRVSLDGKVLAVYPTMQGDVQLKGPDTPGISAVSVAGKDWTVQRSGGYEGMALQPGTNLLWAMAEKPLLGEDGKPAGTALPVRAFDPAKGEWTGAEFKFALAEGATAIGDFNFIDATRALVIERDNGEGLPALKCAGDPAPDCFPLPALVKRVVLIDTAQVDAEGFVKRLGHVDLMTIADPEGKARVETVGGVAGTFTLPFFTIEDVMKVDDTHIMVAVDNNLPYSSGRALDKAMDNEFVLLSVPELLAAK